MSRSADVDELRRRFAHLSKHGAKFDRALATVLSGGVKEARFSPSGRRVLTVVGRLGEEFVDPKKPYCSCSDFYFRVQSGKEPTCYHLLSYTIASESGWTDVVKFDDDEYPHFMRAVVADVYDVTSRG